MTLALVFPIVWLVVLGNCRKLTPLEADTLADGIHCTVRREKRTYRAILNDVADASNLKAVLPDYGMSITTALDKSLHFVTYEWCQSILNPRRQYDQRAHALSGECADALAAAVTTPLDVCKTVLNTQESSARVDGLSEAWSQNLRARGPLGFFQGVQARVFYQMPAAAICWLTYETLKHLLVSNESSKEEVSAPPPPSPLVGADLSRALRLAAADVPTSLTRT